jgi:glycosyltransferase involved in cell wall biosynthesis
MHVLFVGPFPWPSHQGSQAYLASQARGLVARGHRVTVAVYGGGSGGGIPGATVLRARTVPGGAFTYGGLHWSRPFADLALARTIRRYVDAEDVDVLHAHNVEGPLVARLARTGRPIVYDLHTEMADELVTHLPTALRPLGTPVGRRLDRLAMASAHVGCAISTSAHRVLRAAGLPTVMVGPGVDPTELVARPDSARRHDLPARFIAYTGNLDAYQDLPLLYDALPAIDVPLVVVTGSADPVPRGVVVRRTRDHRDALDVLAHADLAVVPRQRCTGFPIKLLNHLGMGCPTVVLDPEPPRIPGIVGTTPDRLASTVNALLAAPDTLRRLGDQARAAILSDWTIAARTARLEALYALALTGSARPARPG